MIDYDPDFYEDEFFDDPETDQDDKSDNDNDIMFIAAAAGLGYEMIQDEIDERKLAEDALRQKDKKRKVMKVPLASRYRESRKGKPFERHMLAVAQGRKKAADSLEYTEEELEKMVKEELKDEIERF